MKAHLVAMEGMGDRMHEKDTHITDLKKTIKEKVGQQTPFDICCYCNRVLCVVLICFRIEFAAGECLAFFFQRCIYEQGLIAACPFPHMSICAL